MEQSSQGENSNSQGKLCSAGETLCREMFSVIILAAGHSKRMGTLKPILKLGDGTILEHSVRLFRDAGVEDVAVVVGHRANEIVPLVKDYGARAIINEGFDRGMFSSVQAGVKALSENSQAFFVLPVDIPFVRPQTIEDLLGTYRGSNGKIAIPVFLGKRGHPPLVDACYRNEILSYSGREGLRGFFRKHDRELIQVEVADEMILFDLDTPSDYQALAARLRRYYVPTPRELNALLRSKFHMQEKVLEHSQAVAELALRLASALNRCGAGLDMELLLSSAMLHDVAKGKANHAAVGAELVSRMGFSAVAQVVAAHTDITINEQDPVDEREVVYLADKLVQGCVVTSLQARLEEATLRYKDDPVAHRSMLDRFDKAKMIKRRFEGILGLSLESTVARRVDESEEAEIQSLLGAAWGN